MSGSEDFLPLPSCRVKILHAFAGVRLVGFLVHGHKWIWIRRRIQVTQSMVDLPVLRFICADVVEEVSHGSVTLGHFPVSNRDFWRFKFVPCRKTAVFDITDGVRVRLDCLFFQVADKSVTDFGRDQVGQEEAVEEDTLCAENQEFHKPARLRHLHER